MPRHQAGYIFAADWEAHVIHVPHPRADGRRDTRANPDKFEAKFGFKLDYPPLIKQTGRGAWSEYYQLLRSGQRPITSLSADLPVTDADLQLLSGRKPYTIGPTSGPVIAIP